MHICKMVGCHNVIDEYGCDFCSSCTNAMDKGYPNPNNQVRLVVDNSNKPKTAADFLKAALGHMEDRASTYDSPQGERSMAKTVQLFNILEDTSLTETQGWRFMTLLKLVRSNQGDFKADNYEDGSAYMGLAGESHAKEQRQQCED